MFHENDLPPVYFAVRNFDVPVATLSVMMGCEPDRVWLQGDPITDAFPDAMRPDSRWILSSGLDREAGFVRHFERLLERLEQAPQLADVLQRFAAGVAVGEFFYHDEADFFLPPELAERYRVLGLAVSFDQLGFDRNGDD